MAFLATVVFVVGGSAAVLWIPYYSRQVVIHEIEKRGGRVFLKRPGASRLADRIRDMWLRQYPNADAVFFSDTQATDADLEYLAHLSDLTYVGLNRTNITDRGLNHLKRLTKLQQISVSSTRVTDSGITELKRELPGLNVIR